MSVVPSPAIGDVVDQVPCWTPGLDDSDGEFIYVDLSAVDQDSKTIASPRWLACTDAPSRARQIIRSGDVLVSTVRPNLNAVGRVPVELDGATASTGFCVLRPRSEVADGAYLFYWVRSPRFVGEMVRRATGASYPAVSDRIVCESKIPLPPLDEQKRIAGILDAADALRAKRREALAELDTLLQSTFLDMFGDPVTNPMGWEVVTVGDEIGFLTSGSRGWAKYYAKDGDTFIRIQNLKDGQLDLGDIAFVNAPESAEARRTKVEPGDVLLSITADLGRTAVVPGGIAKAHINQHLAILRFTSLNPVFVSYQLASKGGQAQFDRLNREGVKAGLNFNDVKSIRLTNPPLDLQHRFAAIVESVEEQKTGQRAHLAELDTLFASLQSRAFRGDL